MSQFKPTPHFVRVLSLGWLAFAVLGFVMGRPADSNVSSGRGSNGRAVDIVIDRGFCPPSQWQQVAADYAQLYQQHQAQQIEITSVTLVNDLGEEVLTEPPTDAEIANLNTFGLSGGDRIDRLLEENQGATVLRCPI